MGKKEVLVKKDVKIFVSYAHRNQGLATKFIDHFKECTEPSMKYEYLWWRDEEDILVGEDWDDEIKNALGKCDIGLLLISAYFLGSSYINNIELRKLRDKPVVPVL